MIILKFLASQEQGIILNVYKRIRSNGGVDPAYFRRSIYADKEENYEFLSLLQR